MDAAEKVFSQFGFEGTSVRMINAEAQVDSGAIHYHFRTKQDLFRAVIKRRGEVLSSDRLMRLARCTDGRGGSPSSSRSLQLTYCRTSILRLVRATKGFDLRG